MLESGLVEITYDTGARVILEGPAEFEVQGKKQCWLKRGKLVGRCPDERSKGFVVETPTAHIVDIGTEFGVDVSGPGLTRVMVFEGDVRVRTTAHGADSSPIELTADESLAISQDGVLQDEEAIEDNFVRRLLPPSTAEIVRISGNIDMLRKTPRSVRFGQLKMPRAMGFFIESRDVELTQNTPVLICVGGRCRLTDRTNKTLPAGTRVDSYYFAVRPHVIPPRKPSKWTGRRKKNPRRVSRFYCSVTFARPVLGVIARGGVFQRTNSTLGHPSTTYPSTANRVEGDDRIWLSKDRRTVHLSVLAHDPTGDRLRVLVDAGTKPRTQEANHQQDK